MVNEDFFTQADGYLPYHRKEKGLILGLTGFAQSGKDSAGQVLIYNKGFRRLAFADALRESLYNLNPIVKTNVRQERQGFWEWLNGEVSRTEITTYRVQDLVDSIGWDRAKVEYTEVRELLQKLGTEAGRNIHGQDCWTNIIKREIESNPYDNFVITDVRFPNEADVIGQLGGKVIKIERPGITSVNNHVSDKGIDNYDYMITNGGSLGDLQDAVLTIVELLTKDPEKMSKPMLTRAKEFGIVK